MCWLFFGAISLLLRLFVCFLLLFCVNKDTYVMPLWFLVGLSSALNKTQKKYEVKVIKI